MSKIIRVVILFLVVFNLNISVISEEKRELNVATKITPPLVEKIDDQYIGYSVDVWDEISLRNNYETNWIEKSLVQELIDVAESGQVDASLSAISQTPDREERIDFTQPYLAAGLQIISTKHTLNLLDYFRIFINSGALRILAVGLVLILLVAHIFWIIKLFTDKSFSRNYFVGVWEGIWWASVGLFQADYGEERPGSRKGQFVLILWLFISLVFLAQLEAVVTAEYTIDRLDGRTSTLSDILNKRVGVVEGTTGQEFADLQKLKTIKYQKTEDLLDAVSSGDTKVGITDVPIISFFETHGGKGLVDGGDVLKPESYSIALPLDSGLRKEINATILEMEQDGTMQDIYDKWFPEAN